jgi:hypothetical protein
MGRRGGRGSRAQGGLYIKDIPTYIHIPAYIHVYLIDKNPSHDAKLVHESRNALRLGVCC